MRSFITAALVAALGVQSLYVHPRTDPDTGAVLAKRSTSTADDAFSGHSLGFQSPNTDHHHQAIATGDIPGDSPISTCDDDLVDDDTLHITHLAIDPNPPEKGQNLTITASGTLEEDVEDGAYVMVDVKYGLIRLLRTKLDLCEQTGKIDLPCPIEKGERTIEKVVELSKAIPPGRYTVNAQVFTKDDDRVTCLNARVQFH